MCCQRCQRRWEGGRARLRLCTLRYDTVIGMPKCTPKCTSVSLNCQKHQWLTICRMPRILLFAFFVVAAIWYSAHARTATTDAPAWPSAEHFAQQRKLLVRRRVYSRALPCPSRALPRRRPRGRAGAGAVVRRHRPGGDGRRVGRRLGDSRGAPGVRWGWGEEGVDLISPAISQKCSRH